jgi:hypothetical protein
MLPPQTQKRNEVCTGRWYPRYFDICSRPRSGDGYGEKADGSPFDGVGIGRVWPLLAGEPAHYALAAGRILRCMSLRRERRHTLSAKTYPINAAARACLAPPTEVGYLTKSVEMDFHLEWICVNFRFGCDFCPSRPNPVGPDSGQLRRPRSRSAMSGQRRFQRSASRK